MSRELTETTLKLKGERKHRIERQPDPETKKAKKLFYFHFDHSLIINN